MTVCKYMNIYFLLLIKKLGSSKNKVIKNANEFESVSKYTKVKIIFIAVLGSS